MFLFAKSVHLFFSSIIFLLLAGSAFCDDEKNSYLDNLISATAESNKIAAHRPPGRGGASRPGGPGVAPAPGGPPQSATPQPLEAPKSKKPQLNSRNYGLQKNQIATAIRQERKHWTAGVNPDFEKLNISDFRYMLGALPEPPKPQGLPTRGPSQSRPGVASGPGLAAAPAAPAYTLPPKRINQPRPSQIPKTYDLRNDYPECPSLSSIRYQYRCSNCWAVTAASVMSDRHCIYNFKTTGQLYLSHMEVTACVPNGCDGGKEWNAFQYWIDNGLVTGGTAYTQANEPDGCLPFPANISQTPASCPTTCVKSYSKTYKNDKIYGGTWYDLSDSSIEQIQQEIMDYGPVVAFFHAYNDLFYYTSGVYEHLDNSELAGYHLTKLIGWGTQGGVDYWQAVNTWGVKWGEQGFFKIRRGANTCGIENRLSAPLPKEALVAPPKCTDEIYYCYDYLSSCGKEGWTEWACRKTCKLC